MTVIGNQFITLTVDIGVHHGWREALRPAGLSAAAETCSYSFASFDNISTKCKIGTIAAIAELLAMSSLP